MNISNYAGSKTTLSNNLTVDPGFTNAAASNFTLRPASAAINTGVTLAEVPYDYNKTPRPQGGKHDIGAYEFGVLSAPTPAPASNLLISQSTILTTNRRLKTGDTLSQYENRKKGRKNQNHGNLADLFKDLKPAKES